MTWCRTLKSIQLALSHLTYLWALSCLSRLGSHHARWTGGTPGLCETHGLSVLPKGVALLWWGFILAGKEGGKKMIEVWKLTNGYFAQKGNNLGYTSGMCQAIQLHYVFGQCSRCFGVQLKDSGCFCSCVYMPHDTHVLSTDAWLVSHRAMSFVVYPERPKLWVPFEGCPLGSWWVRILILVLTAEPLQVSVMPRHIDGTSRKIPHA